MKRAEEKVVDSQEKLEYGKKDEVEKHCRVLKIIGRKRSYEVRLPFQRFRQGTLRNLMFLEQKGLPKEGRMRT